MWTTHRDPGGWPGRPRSPQHAAAPVGLASPARLQAQRALRLFRTAGIWAAGLCLVIGALVLVLPGSSSGRMGRLTMESSSQPNAGHSAAASNRIGRSANQPARGPSKQASVRSRPAPGANDSRHSRHGSSSQLIAAFAGRGDKTTPQFGLSGRTVWQIKWSYSCPPGLPLGLLLVEDATPGTAGVRISQSGTAGQGDTVLSPDGRIHRLVVISTCSWTMKVMQST
jgi:hypothetical protein